MNQKLKPLQPDGWGVSPFSAGKGLRPKLIRKPCSMFTTTLREAGL